jgi:hypothetical protein
VSDITSATEIQAPLRIDSVWESNINKMLTLVRGIETSSSEVDGRLLKCKICEKFLCYLS